MIDPDDSVRDAAQILQQRACSHPYLDQQFAAGELLHERGKIGWGREQLLGQTVPVAGVALEKALALLPPQSQNVLSTGHVCGSTL